MFSDVAKSFLCLKFLKICYKYLLNWNYDKAVVSKAPINIKKKVSNGNMYVIVMHDLWLNER